MGHRALIQFLRECDGTTAVEYAVLVSLILLVCIGSINVLGQSIALPVQDAAQQIKSAGDGGVTVKKTRGTQLTPGENRRSSFRH